MFSSLTPLKHRRFVKDNTLNTKLELILFPLQSTMSLHRILKQQSKIKSPK